MYLHTGFLVSNKKQKFIYTNMLQFSKSSVTGEIVVTLTELSTIAEPFYYLFIFTHTETRTQVKKILSTQDDESLFKYRFNKWTINISDFFGDAPVGKYTYEVYEQESDADTTTDGKTLVENGRSIILPQSEFEFENYDTATTYKSYNG